jgi:hypothetical protein
MKKLHVLRAIWLEVAGIAALMLLSYALWFTPWFGRKDPRFILGLWIAMALAAAMDIHTKIKKKVTSDPDQ